MGVIYLIRHAQASFGAADYDQLSPLGHEQARVLGTILRERLDRVDAVWSGRMRRHRDTASGVLAALEQPPPLQVHAGLDEFDHDEVLQRYKPIYASRALMLADLARTLQPRQAFQEAFSAAMRRWQDGAHDADYTESWPQFRGRCAQTVRDLARAAGPSRTVLAFTSGGCISAVVQELLALPVSRVLDVNIAQVNASLTKIVYGDKGLRLVAWNEHGHWEGERRHLLTWR